MHIRRYVHLATGNYNPTTAKLYTDLGPVHLPPGVRRGRHQLLQSADRHLPVPEPAQAGGGAVRAARPPAAAWSSARRENARQGLPARIILKLNSLADRRIIEALYRASEAGVKIDLIVRGICCLRPGLKGVSENITVRSIVDRFLEHSRIYYFENACQPQVFISSADWMPRNFFRRIELAIPDRGRRAARADHQRNAGDFAGGQRQGPLPAAGRVVSARGASPMATSPAAARSEFMALTACGRGCAAQAG